MTTWSQYEHALAELQAEAGARARDDIRPASPALPAPDVPEHIVEAALGLAETPALLWDVPGLTAHVDAILDLLAPHDFQASVAVKACPNRDVLAILAADDIGADLASVGELPLAQAAGFGRISATGPSFRAADLAELHRAGASFDVQSPRQLEHHATGTPIGVRLRVPLPDELRAPTSRGLNSRFGLRMTRDTVAALRQRGPVGRIRVHTGECTPQTLEFRARYALLVAGLFPDVTEINLGGGFLGMSRDQDTFAKAMDAVAGCFTEYERRTGRRFRVWIEPGNGLLLDSAYLVTEVMDVARDRNAVTVDASAWNIAPWARSHFFLLGRPPRSYRGLVYGASLYEEDYFLPSYSTGAASSGGDPSPGDRLLGTSFGAYTIANARTFGGLTIPQEHLIDPIL